MSKNNYLAIGWDELQGPSGSIIGLFSGPDLAFDAIRNYLGKTPLLFHENAPLVSDELEYLIERNKTMTETGMPHYEPIILHDDHNNQIAIFKLILDVAIA